MEKDPVCGMDVDPHRTPHRSEHEGRTYYFCAARCRERFAADPARFLSPVPDPVNVNVPVPVPVRSPMY